MVLALFSELVYSALSLQGQAYDHFLGGFSGHPCSDQASRSLQNVLSQPPRRACGKRLLGVQVLRGPKEHPLEGFPEDPVSRQGCCFPGWC